MKRGPLEGSIALCSFKTFLMSLKVSFNEKNMAVGYKWKLNITGTPDLKKLGGIVYKDI